MAFSTSFWDITKSVGVLAMVAIIGFCGYKFFNKPTISPDMKNEIIGHVTKAVIQESDKQLKVILKQNNASIKAAKAHNDEKIKEVGKIVVGLKQTAERRLGSNHIYDRDNVLAHEFIKIYRKDADGNKFLAAWAMYHPNQVPEKRWKTGTYPLVLNTTVIETENEEGTSNIYVDVFAKRKDKEFPLDVNEVQWVRKEIKDKKFSFNTRLGFTGFIGVDIYPGVDISLFSYGRTKRDLDWRFAIFGAGMDNDSVYGHFSPAQYNIGNFVPLIENMYVGPFISIDDDLELEYGGGVSVLF